MHSKHRMLFFTPELYSRYNSPDDEIALAADADWEAAIVGYHQYLDTQRGKMSSSVIELSELCLHDGEILQRQERQHPLGISCSEDGSAASRPWPVWYGVATLAVRLDNELVSLFYFLCDHMTEHHTEEWQFSNKREHWLYDEIQWQGGTRGSFAHLILLSSGVVLTVPFSSVLISRFPLSPVAIESGKQIA